MFNEVILNPLSRREESFCLHNSIRDKVSEQTYAWIMVPFSTIVYVCYRYINRR